MPRDKFEPADSVCSVCEGERPATLGHGWDVEFVVVSKDRRGVHTKKGVLTCPACVEAKSAEAER